MIKIIDCFLFSFELDMLKFRLKELNDAVDYFVLVEATHTHGGWNEKEYRGIPKKLLYEENKHLFEEYKDKIIHVVVDDFAVETQQWKGEWDREFHQREAITRGLNQLSLQDNDVIIINDCDEIPNSDLLKQFKLHGGFNIFSDNDNLKYIQDNTYIDIIANREVIGLLYDYYYYNLECKKKNWWWLPKAVTYKTLKKIKSIQSIRMTDTTACFINSGWHFSFFGGVDSIITKIKTYSHQEYNTDYIVDKERIQEQINQFKDVFERTDEFLMKIPIEENIFLPKNYKMLL
jgi:beta-1,4-mannosyl-glycoprotein beta-1,4-N-acetylglucosaminyltransferase